MSDGVEDERKGESKAQEPSELDWNQRLEKHLQARLDELEEARAPVKGAAVNYGAANYPHDSRIWVPDWRDNLPDDDPRRQTEPPIVKSGSVAAYHKMTAASAAIRSAYGLPPEVDSAQHPSATQDT